MEREQTITDHAAMSDAEHLARSVRVAKDAPGFALWKPWALDLADAVIALVAERDRWRAVACNVKDGTAAAEAELAEAKREVSRLHDLHLDRTKNTHRDLTELIARAEAAEAELAEWKQAADAEAFAGDEARADNARLREALHRWGRHENGCTATGLPPRDCTCGLTEVAYG